MMHLKRNFKLWNKSFENSQAVLRGEQMYKALFVKLCVLNPGIHRENASLMVLPVLNPGVEMQVTDIFNDHQNKCVDAAESLRL